MEMAALITVSGIIIVFTTLVVLTLLIYLLGAVSNIKRTGKKSDNDAKQSGNEAKTEAPSSSSVYTAAAPQDSDDDIIAVIAAAVAQCLSGDGKQYKIRSIKPAGNGSAWRYAAVLDNTRPF